MALAKSPFEIGTRIGDWEVIGQLEEVRPATWGQARVALSRVRCVACGAERILKNNYLRAGGSQSCGCSRGRALGQSRVKHGKSYTPIYTLWRGIKQRLKHMPSYAGVRMHAPWEHDFPAFESFIESLGPKPTPEHTLDRIESTGHYEPGNLRWADKKTQSENRRNNKFRNVLDKSIVAVGEKHGMLTVTGLLVERRHGVTWYCATVRCECGTEKTVYQKQLLTGRTRSCGCYRQRNLRLGRLALEKPIEANGQSMSMSAWALKLGVSKHVIWTRINKYGWDVARAVTEPVQRDPMIEIDGEKLTAAQWSERHGVPVRTIWVRIHEKDWEPARAVTTPVRVWTRKTLDS